VLLRHAVLIHRSPDNTVVMRQLPADTDAAWGTVTDARYAPADRVWLEAEPKLLSANSGVQTTVFLHEIHTRSGTSRVLAVNMSPSWRTDGVVIEVELRLFDPGAIFHPRFRELRIKENRD